MRNKWKLVVAVILITIISWLDYQYFMERNTHLKVSDDVRKLFHILSLLGVTITGCVAWKRISKAIFVLWTGTYTVVFLFIVLIGLLNRFIHFNDDFLNEISRLRMFFCSPMPFAALYVFYKLFSKKNAGASS
jgi:hypothetical protein